MPPGEGQLELSVIAPAHNEQDNLRPLVDEIIAAVDSTVSAYEIIVVDDGSTDASPKVLNELLAKHASLRVIRLAPQAHGKGRGQSAAFAAGFAAARGEIIATLDADLQNDPADIPRLLAIRRHANVDLVQGDRSAARRDGIVKRVSSRIGRLFRRVLLGDTIRDTGCSLRVMKRQVAQSIPLQFRGMHRFIPITARQLGFLVTETPVNHRPRTRGRTNYGVWNRALPGLIDCLAVRWMRTRRTDVGFEEVFAPESFEKPKAASASRTPAEMSQP